MAKLVVLKVLLGLIEEVGNNVVAVVVCNNINNFRRKSGFLSPLGNTAYAMGVSREVGSIAVGKKANFYISKPIPSYEYMPYAYGENKVERIFLNGIEI